MTSHPIVSQQRLTLFAMLSAIENDARIIISSNLLPEKAIATIIPEEVVNVARTRMQRSAHLVTDNSDAALLDFMNVGDHFQTLQRWKSELNDGIKKILTFNSKIETLVAIRNRVMHGRPLDFDDLPFLKNFSEDIVRLDPFHWIGTRELLKNLRRDPGFAFEFEKDFEIEDAEKILHNLPSPDFDDTGFVGRSEQIDKLRNAIKGAFPIITVLGEGGLGKTSLALKVLYDNLDELSKQFDAVVWTTAKATVLTSTDIVQIENAIKDSLGIFEAANTFLGESGDSEPLGTLKSGSPISEYCW